MNSLVFASLVTAALLPAPRDNREVAESVFVEDSEIYARYAASADSYQLTSDGTPKGSAALSKDGRRIAFLSDAHDRALGTITIILADGTRLREIAFRPVEAHISVMRFVEGLEWITDRRLAVSGSVNPSTGEYAIIDVETGKEVAWYLVDGPAWAPSPDGTHAAYVGYTPHFTPHEDRQPQFCIDDECSFDHPFRGYPRPPRHIEFTTKPVWSPDGTAVAIAAEDYATKATSVIVRPLQGNPSEYAVPPGADAELKISWDGTALVARTATQAWRLDRGASALSPSKP